MQKAGDIVRSHPNELAPRNYDYESEAFKKTLTMVITIMAEGNVLRNPPKNVDAALAAWHKCLRNKVPLEGLMVTCESFLDGGGWHPTANEFVERWYSIRDHEDLAETLKRAAEESVLVDKSVPSEALEEIAAKGISEHSLEAFRIVLKHTCPQMYETLRAAKGLEAHER